MPFEQSQPEPDEQQQHERGDDVVCRAVSDDQDRDGEQSWEPEPPVPARLEPFLEPVDTRSDVDQADRVLSLLPLEPFDIRVVVYEL